MRIKIGIGVLILAALSFLILWGSKPKEVLNTASMAVLADTTTPTSSLSLAAPEEPEEELPTIKRSQVPDYPLLFGGSMDADGKYTTVLVRGDSIEVPISLSYPDDIIPLHIKSPKGKNDLINQYSPDDIITSYYESDIDGDGVKEKLVTLCGDGANHCSDYSQIIKNDKVIFSVKLNGDGAGYGDGITPAKEGGFYVEWTNDASFYDEKGKWTGLCCSASHNKTLFQFKNGKFIPIKQWKTFHVWKRVVED